MAIKEIIRNQKVGSQEELLQLLQERNYNLTQATLSRDLKQLKVAKMPDQDGRYCYMLPEDASLNHMNLIQNATEDKFSLKGFISLDFCGLFVVVKTKPGYSGSIAAEIDQKATAEVLGTIAGDDTILIIPREQVSRSDLIKALSEILPI